MAKESLANALRSICFLYDCLERTAAGSEVMLRDGKALAGGYATGETAAIENLMISDTPGLLEPRLQPQSTEEVIVAGC